MQSRCRLQWSWPSALTTAKSEHTGSVRIARATLKELVCTGCLLGDTRGRVEKTSRSTPGASLTEWSPAEIEVDVPYSIVLFCGVSPCCASQAVKSLWVQLVAAEATWAAPFHGVDSQTASHCVGELIGREIKKCVDAEKQPNSVRDSHNKYSTLYVTERASLPCARRKMWCTCTQCARLFVCVCQSVLYGCTL